MNKTYLLIWIGVLIGQCIWSTVKMIMIQRENPLVTYREAAHIVFVKGALSYVLSFFGVLALTFIMPDFIKSVVDQGTLVPEVQEMNGLVAAFVNYTRALSVLFGIGEQTILMSVVFRVSAWGRALNKSKEEKL